MTLASQHDDRTCGVDTTNDTRRAALNIADALVGVEDSLLERGVTDDELRIAFADAIEPWLEGYSERESKRRDRLREELRRARCEREALVDALTECLGMRRAEVSERLDAWSAGR